MRCPGKNALFSGIDLNFNSIYNKKKYLIFDVANYEERIKMFTINVSGFMYLRIKSFANKMKFLINLSLKNSVIFFFIIVLLILIIFTNTLGEKNQ